MFNRRPAPSQASSQRAYHGRTNYTTKERPRVGFIEETRWSHSSLFFQWSLQNRVLDWSPVGKSLFCITLASFLSRVSRSRSGIVLGFTLPFRHKAWFCPPLLLEKKDRPTGMAWFSHFNVRCAVVIINPEQQYNTSLSSSAPNPLVECRPTNIERIVFQKTFPNTRPYPLAMFFKYRKQLAEKRSASKVSPQKA